MNHLRVTPRFALPALAAMLLLTTGAAAEPVEVPVGDLLIVRTAKAERWYITAHGGTKRNVLVISVSEAGEVTMGTIPLPDSTGGPDGDDPKPTDLTTLVRQWAVEANDPAGRVKLAAAYGATVSLIDGGQIDSVDTLIALQRAANSLVLGSSASKWSQFFTKLAAHLDANTPADLAGYRAAWLQISAGLKE